MGGLISVHFSVQTECDFSHVTATFLRHCQHLTAVIL